MLGELMPCAGGPPIPLLKPKLVLGRQTSCDIPLTFPSVSSRHCELELRDGYWFVHDLGSSNGTRVNGTICKDKALMPNDVLALAKLRYTLQYMPPAGRTQPRVKASSSPAMPAVARMTSEEKKGQPRANTTSPRPSGASGLGELVPCGGGDPISLLQRKLILGRHEECDIVLRSSSISGRHCELEWTDGAWIVRDLNSHNGIRVDGVRCSTQKLAPGSTLSIASFRYRIVYGQPVGAAPTAKGPIFEQSLLEAAGLALLQKQAENDRQEPVDDDGPKRIVLDGI